MRLARKAWRRLISMRTALVLLFLLALAAVPGSLLPQRPLNPAKVDTYLASTARGAVSSTSSACSTCSARRGSRRSTCCCSCRWSAAWSRGSACTPGRCAPSHCRAPKNLDRLPESGRFESGDTAEEYARAASGRHSGRRWRVDASRRGRRRLTLSAEKGYSRETGNLIFHIALLVGARPHRDRAAVQLPGQR